MGLLLLSLGNKIERGQRMVKEVGAGCLGAEPTSYSAIRRSPPTCPGGVLLHHFHQRLCL